MTKIAYPQEEFGSLIDPPRDVRKWMTLMKTIYSQAPALGWNNAFDKVTAGSSARLEQCIR